MKNSITIRLTDTQLDFIKKESEERDISVSKYIQMILFTGDFKKENPEIVWKGPSVLEQREQTRKLNERIKDEKGN